MTARRFGQQNVFRRVLIVRSSRTYVGTVGQTWTLSPSTVVDTTAGYSLLDLATRPPDYGTNYGLDVLGISGTNGSDVRQSGFPELVTGYTALGNDDAIFPSFYTWSKSMNMADEDGWVALLYNSPSQFERNYALAGFDRTHNFQMAWAYELPFGRSANGSLSQLIRNW
ncbi:MAG: hypothetical protein GEV06_21710 [Luteitalea sp.]|nr:hypothetical protein [Luteitalea sp.]